MNDTIKSANFDSVVSHDPVTGLPVYDRPLRGEDVREMYKMIVSDGVYPNPSTSFQVMEGENDNEVIVKAGFGWVQGCPVWDLSDDVVELDPADENNPRIDLVVLQWNNLLANRWVQKVVITGTASATPSAPALTRTADVYEICLAEIERPAGSSLVIQSEITDTRGDDDLCGWTHGIVDQVDTSTIFNQYASWLQDIQDQWEAWWETQQETTGYLTTGGDYTTLKTFDKKVIHAINEVNDGSIALGRAHSGDGILSGCEMAISGSTLVIQPGEIIAGGKPVIFTSAVEVDLSGISISNGYVQVILNIKASLNPALWFTFAESSTTTFPDLTRDSLLVLGNLYQKQLAIVQVSGGNLTSIYSSLNVSYVTLTSKETNTHMNMSIEGNYSNLATSTDDGTAIGGFVAYETGKYTLVYHNQGDIIFRPNGNGSGAGEVRIKPTGQIIGGARHFDASQSGTITVSSPASWFKICSIQNVEAGTYLAYGSYGFTGAGYNTQSFSYIGIGNTNGGWSLFNPQVRMATATQYSLQNQIASPYYVGSTQSEVSLWGQCQNQNTIIRNGYLTLIRIA